MKTIVNPNRTVKNLIGNQKPKDVEYRLLKYTLEVEVEEGVLLDNVITGQIVLLSEKERNILDLLPRRYDETIESLISAYFLVPVDFDEYAFVRGYRGILQQVERNKKKPIK